MLARNPNAAGSPPALGRVIKMNGVFFFAPSAQESPTSTTVRSTRERTHANASRKRRGGKENVTKMGSRGRASAGKKRESEEPSSAETRVLACRNQLAPVLFCEEFLVLRLNSRYEILPC